MVAGNGALVVNNEPQAIPGDGPRLFSPLVSGLLATDPAYTPYGVEKFEWDPEADDLRVAWVNTEVSSPNAIPLVSTQSNLVYAVGVRDGKWSLEALDWKTGEEAFHWVLNGSRTNAYYAAIELDPDGNITYGTLLGRLRLVPED
ncbi:MAG TPA: hypothetical protein VFZ79_16260 [Acidimicrobiales bacterium]